MRNTCRIHALCALLLCALLLGAWSPAFAADHYFTTAPLHPDLAGATDLAAGEFYRADFSADMLFAVPGVGIFGNPNFDALNGQSFEGGPNDAREIELCPGMATSGLDAFVTLGQGGLRKIEWDLSNQSIVVEDIETWVSRDGKALRVGDVDGDLIPEVLCLSSTGNAVICVSGKKTKSIAPLPAGATGFELELVDLDGVGGLDVVVLTGDMIVGITGVGLPGSAAGVSQVLHAFGPDWIGTHICRTQHPARATQSVAFVAEPLATGAFFSMLGTVDLGHLWSGTYLSPYQTAAIDSVDLDPSLQNGSEIVLTGNSGVSAVVFGVGDITSDTSPLYDTTLGEDVGFVLHAVGIPPYTTRPVVGDFDRDGDDDAAGILGATGELAYLRSQEVRDSEVNMTAVPLMYVAASPDSRQEWCRPADTSDPLDYLGLRFWRPAVDVLASANALEVVVYRRIYPHPIEAVPWHYSIHGLPSQFFTSAGLPTEIDPSFYYYTSDEDVAVCVPVTACFSDASYPLIESYHVLARLVERDASGAVIDAGPITMIVVTNDPVLTEQYATEFKLAYGHDGALGDIYLDVGGVGAGAQTGSGSAEPIYQGPFPMPPPRGLPTGGTP